MVKPGERVRALGECLGGRVKLALIPQADTQEVVRFRHLRGELDQLTKQRDGAGGTPGAMVRKRQLVQDPRCPVIPRHVCGIVPGRLFVATERLRHVTQSLEGAGRLGRERAGSGQVPQRGGQIAPTVVGLAPFQVGEHALALQRDGAAETPRGRGRPGRDRARRLRQRRADDTRCRGSLRCRGRPRPSPPRAARRSRAASSSLHRTPSPCFGARRSPG